MAPSCSDLAWLPPPSTGLVLVIPAMTHTHISGSRSGTGHRLVRGRLTQIATFLGLTPPPKPLRLLTSALVTRSPACGSVALL